MGYPSTEIFIHKTLIREEKFSKQEGHGKIMPTPIANREDLNSSNLSFGLVFQSSGLLAYELLKMILNSMVIERG